MSARHNPFATDRVERLLAFQPGWASTVWSEIETRWNKLGCRAAITGRHGSGKTTCLDAWQLRLEQQGRDVQRIFLNRDRRKLAEADWQGLRYCAGKVVLLDGEEQLAWVDRQRLQRLSRSADGLLVSRHRRFSLTGLSLPVVLHLDPGTEVLRRCVQILAPDQLDLLEPQLKIWWRQEKGNIRQILLRCYDAMG